MNGAALAPTSDLKSKHLEEPWSAELARNWLAKDDMEDLLTCNGV